MRAHIDYGDVFHDQPSHISFSSKIESVQDNAAVAIIEAIKGSPCDKLYKELRLECLQQRR